jgi:hypothetical protein
MNKFLADSVAAMNAAMAMFFIVIGAVGGTQLGYPNNPVLIFTLLGTVGGLLIAIVFCGFIAVLVEIREELIRIRKVG